ncbi:ATP-binding protein [Thermodesulfobacteriota bacterium]
MDLYDFLEEQTFNISDLKLLEHLDSVYGAASGMQFCLLDKSWTQVTDDGRKNDLDLSLIDAVSKGKPFALQPSGTAQYDSVFGIKISGELQGFLYCRIDIAPLTSAPETLQPEAVMIMLAAPLAEEVDLFCRNYDIQQKNIELQTRVKHVTNSMDVIREQQHNVLNENIQQREELEKMNEELLFNKQQLEDYGRNLEKKVEDRTKELKIAKDRAEESDRFKSQFLANMSHEMRTPLNSIIGFVEMVLEEQGVDGKHEDYLQRVDRNSQHLLHLVNDILDLSKLQARQMKMETIPVALDKLFDDTESNGQTLIKQRKKTVELRKCYSTDVSNYILGDPKRLLQIMNNLISNAVKFTDSGYVAFGVAIQRPDMLQFYVKDTGIGIPPEKHDLVFQSFQQADGSTTRKYGGTGLGLTITKNIIELMGGTVWIESQEGRGSTFYFTMPYKPAKPPESAQKDDRLPVVSISAEKSTVTILLVEDSIDNQMLAKTILVKQGFSILIANDGMEAVDIFKDKHAQIDIILMDMQMPRMGGLEATGIIRQCIKDQGLKQLPIIALTAGAMEGDREQCLDAGCDDYLTKPIRKRKLIEMLQKFTKEEI